MSNELQEFLVRDMVSADLHDVLQVEQTAHISPWARLSFEESLTKGNICRVIVSKKGICAYHVISQIMDELHVLNIACAPRVQGFGLGHRLMQDIIEIAQARELSKIFLEVRASNAIAQSLYHKWGFEKISIRKQYYRASQEAGKREDAWVYLRHL